MALTFPGNTDFEQSAPARWQPGGWEFDKLIVPFRGNADALPDFEDSLAQWQASTIDTNMFLETWPNDAHLQFPTVELTYIGKRGGVLPGNRTTRGSGLGTVSRADVAYEGVTISFTITFASATSTVTWISREEVQRPTAGYILPGTSAPSYGVSLMVRNPNYFDSLLSDDFYFGAVDLVESVADFHSDEIVPGEYWKNSMTTMWSLQ